MGLTKHSVGKGALDSPMSIRRNSAQDRVVALAGNPNVGKSTVFNAITGMNQHTGNWPGKTVTSAQGACHFEGRDYIVVDLPGTYSLLAHSAEETVARDFICFGDPDAVAIVCDATALERNLNLVLQIMEAHSHTVICVNLMDEAKRKGIRIDLSLLQERLGIPVVGTVARKKKSLQTLLRTIESDLTDGSKAPRARIPYPEIVERALEFPLQVIHRKDIRELDTRWLSLKLLDRDDALTKAIQNYLGETFEIDSQLTSALEQAWDLLRSAGIDADGLHDLVATASVSFAEELIQGVVVEEGSTHRTLDRKVDKILTGRLTAYPVMLLLLAFIFWLTIEFSNIPSQWLSDFLFSLLDKLSEWLGSLYTPPWLCGALTDGILRVLCWVISVMLPPMAIFFPLFTILEDVGYLPRVAYNLDRPFARCQACGKQALTMCMGFGCNAAGVVGCRIIDSPRERLLAILTNSFVPCNGRFPALISILTMFFIGFSGGITASALASILLCVLIILGILATFFFTKLLSKTLLRGMPSSFVLEMPPYRMPQIGKVLVRSIFDRTLFVLGRAAVVAAPAGLLIWCMANIQTGNGTLLLSCADFLDPFANLLGMDGIILMAFILGFPANEIVIPIIIMGYLSTGTLTELNSLSETRALLIANGWTWMTAVSVLIFFLMHWPCSTTLLTVKKETGSLKWTAVAAILPTMAGILLCMLFTAVAKVFF